MKLLETERIITESANKEVTLTNLRIRKLEGSSAKGTLTSILLRNISSIKMVYSRKGIFLFLGILGLIGSLALIAEREDNFAWITGILGVVFLILYILSKSHFITIASTGGATINLLTKGMKDSSILDFINKVEAAIIHEAEVKTTKYE